MSQLWASARAASIGRACRLQRRFAFRRARHLAHSRRRTVPAIQLAAELSDERNVHWAAGSSQRAAPTGLVRAAERAAWLPDILRVPCAGHSMPRVLA